MFSGLAPATNYTVLMSVGSGSILVGTVVVVSGVLTPDTNAPTFQAVGPMQVWAVRAVQCGLGCGGERRAHARHQRAHLQGSRADAGTGSTHTVGSTAGAGWVGGYLTPMLKAIGPSGVRGEEGRRPSLDGTGPSVPAGQYGKDSTVKAWVLSPEPPAAQTCTHIIFHQCCTPHPPLGTSNGLTEFCGSCACDCQQAGHGQLRSVLVRGGTTYIIAPRTSHTPHTR